MPEPFTPRFHMLNNQVLTTLDVENTFQISVDGRHDPTPFNAHNDLVCVGYKMVRHKDGRFMELDNFLWFYHQDRSPTPDAIGDIQRVLRDTDIVIGHNIKHDIEWLEAVGVDIPYYVDIWDTMLTENILVNGYNYSISLEECCSRRNIGQKVVAEVEEFLKKGIQFDKMPPDLVKGRNLKDVDLTYRLFETQLNDIGIDNIQELLDATNLYRQNVGTKIKSFAARFAANNSVNKSDVPSFSGDRS